MGVIQNKCATVARIKKYLGPISKHATLPGMGAETDVAWHDAILAQGEFSHNFVGWRICVPV